MTKRGQLLLIFLSSILLLLSSFYFLSNYLDKHVIWNTHIEGKKISGLSFEDLRELIEKESNHLNDAEIVLEVNGEMKPTKWSELGISHDGESLFKEIYREQHSGLGQTLSLVGERISSSRDYSFPSYFEEDTFDSNFKKLFPSVVSSSKPAKVQVIGSRLKLEAGTPGKEVDKDAFLKVILQSRLENHSQIVVPLKDSSSDLNLNDFDKMGLKEIVGQYTTTFPKDLENRTHNIKLASDSIDGTLLKPGEIFDFNKIVGETTYSTGYKDAAVFSNGQVVEGVGGGICQVSSTLYNAVLDNDLEVVERRNHGLPVSYVPLGRDATVAWGYLNFRFKNDTKHHLYVHSAITDDQLTVTLVGTKRDVAVYIESEEVSRVKPPTRELYDSSLSSDERVVSQEGVYGYHTRTWKTIREGGHNLEKVLISEDYYKPLPRIILSGSKR